MARPSRMEDARRRLRDVLPDGWTVSVAKGDAGRSGIRIASPSDTNAELEVLRLVDATPRSVAALNKPAGRVLVVTDWLSERAQELLRSQGLSFLDATGNTEIRLSEPGLFVRTQGSRRNPSPTPTRGPTLRGPKAWALLRTLAEVPPPIGVRELAESVDVDAGYVSRVLGVLERELLVTRKPRGPVTAVEWEGVLRRAAATYSLFDSNRMSTWVATGGPDRLIDDLASKQAGQWAITGSFAAARLAPVAAPEVAVLYAGDVDRLARAGRLLPAVRGANVILAQPYDSVVFDRTVISGAETYVSTAQVTLDCLRGNGRMPAEGEAVLAWMRKNEARWREGSLQPRRKRRGIQ